MNEIKAPTLSSLADSLIDEIISIQKRDPFNTITVAFSSLVSQQWFKAYWLKTKQDKVLMNVKFVSLNDILPEIAKDSNNKNYKLIKHNALKQIITSILLKECDENKSYYLNEDGSFNNVKLNDYASSLTSTFLAYFQDDFLDNEEWKKSEQYKLYLKVVDRCKSGEVGTLENPIKNDNDGHAPIYLFGFASFNKVIQRLINDCPFINCYLLEETKSNTDYEMIKAPSLVREIEYVHSEICKYINAGARVNDFLVVAPNVKDYINVIERVFKQNDTEYPSIPYVISHYEKEENDVTDALNLLFKIYKNGFYTRKDFYILITNPIIQKVRSINNEEVDNWMQSIVELKVHRNHEALDDFDYFKKRLLLSKISSINFYDDNIVTLKDGDYLPYSSTPLDDESISRLVNVINDLDNFIVLLNSKNKIDEAFVNDVKTQLDKWFSYQDLKDKINPLYSKVISSLNTFIKLKNYDVPVDVFFFTLIDDSCSSSHQRGDAFLSGVTFTDFNINSVYTADYIFFIGANSSTLPKQVIKSEIDYRLVIKDPDEERKGLYLLYQNATKHFHLSYVSQDLKKETDYYPSSLIIDFNDSHAKKTFVSVSLDEKRPYHDLYTRKEFNDKKYYLSLLNEGQANAEENKKNKVNNITDFNSLTTSNLKDFLLEPLMFKASLLFNKDNTLYKDIQEEWETFNLSPLEEYKPFHKLLLIYLEEKTLDDRRKEEIYRSFKCSNIITSISDDYDRAWFYELVEEVEKTYNVIVDVTNGNYDILAPTSLMLVTSQGKEWKLTRNNELGLSINENERLYFEIKKIDETASPDKFLPLYVMSLMDVAALKDEKEYTIILVKGEKDGKIKNLFSDRAKACYRITPSEARELLNIIYNLINDYSDIAFIPFKKLDARVGDYSSLSGLLNGEHGAWEYFDHKGMFNKHTDLGYDQEAFDIEYKKEQDDIKNQGKQDNTIDALKDKNDIYLAKLNEILELIKYLEPIQKEDEEEEDNDGQE